MLSNFRVFLLACAIGLMPLSVFSQLARKPSIYDATALRERSPIGQGSGAATEPFLARVAHKAAAMSLARVQDRATSFEIPHLLFVIDRGAENRVYFVNSRRFDLHEQFLQAQGLIGETTPAPA